jgi:putative membrane protein
MAPATYMVPQSLSQASYNFVITAALGDSYEIQAGTMARQRAQSQQIRQFADQMVRDHTLLTQQMATALQMNGTPVVTPAALDPRHQTMINDLMVAQGPDFDRRYAIQQVAAHQEALTVLQAYAQNGDNPALRQFAQQALPRVQEHLRMAQMLPGAG